MKIEPSGINLEIVLDKMADKILQPRTDDDGNVVAATAEERFRVKNHLLPMVSMALPAILEQVNTKIGASIDEQVGTVVIPDNIGGLSGL